MPEYALLTFNGTSINSTDSNYMTVIPDLDAMVENSIGVLRGHHVAPSFGRPTPLERVLTCNIYIIPTSTGGTFYSDFDAKLDTLKQLLDTNSGAKTLAVQRSGWTRIRTLSVHTRQFAVNRLERRVSVQFVAADPYWKDNSARTQQNTLSSSGATFVVANSGTKYALPKFSLRILTNNPNTWLYTRNIVLSNNIPVTLPAGYCLDITGGGWDTATLISGGKMLSSGDDLRVEFDGVEIPRFLTGINTSTTKVWIVTPVDIPSNSLGPNNSTLVTLGNDLAPVSQAGYAAAVSFLDANATGTILGNNVASNVIYTQWGGTPPPVGSPALQWQTTGTTGTIKLDLGTSQNVSRVTLAHLPGNSRALNFTIATSPDNVSYTTRVTVTNNPTTPYATAHDFDAVACRYVRIDITAMTGALVNSQGTGMVHVNVFNAIPRLVVKYGNAHSGPPGSYTVPSQPSITLPASSTAFSPMFDAVNSTNQRIVYDGRFVDTTTEGRYRPGQWSKASFFYGNKARDYSTSKSVTVDSNPTNVLGLLQDGSLAQTGGADSFSYTNPCGLFAINHSGNTKHNNTYAYFRQTTQKYGSAYQDIDFNNTVDTSPAWSFYSYQWFSYNPPSYNETRTATFFTLVRIGIDPLSAIHAGEAKQVTFQLISANVPSVQWLSEQGAAGGTIVSWAAMLKNTTTNEALTFSVTGFVTGVSAGTDLVIDCDAKTITRSDTGASLLTSLIPDTVRAEWMTLAPGNNTFSWTEPNVVSIRVQTDWSDRWN